ncbi:hypothetical protein Tco_0240995 [Tanacetum coccineum]
MIIPESDGTQKFTDEVDELKAISGHMLGASGVQIPQKNLDNLQSLREEDGTSETVDPQDCLGSLELELLDSTILTLLLELADLVAFGLLLILSFFGVSEGTKSLFRTLVFNRNHLLGNIAMKM